MFILVIALIILSVFFITVGVVSMLQQHALTMKIKTGGGRDEFPEDEGLVKNIKNLALNAGVYISKKTQFGILKKNREVVQKKLKQSGLADKFNPNLIIGYQLLMAIAAILVSVLLLSIYNVILLLLFGICGWVAPILWLDGKVKKRQKEIFRQLPDSLDILTLLVEAGLDFGAAFNKLIEHETGPLINEFYLAQQEIKLGKNRHKALSDMALRVENKHLTSVVTSIVQSMQTGTSLAPTLRVLSDEFRVQRTQVAEEMGARAPVKMLFPMLFFIFPSLFIIIFGPIVLRLLLGGPLF